MSQQPPYGQDPQQPYGGSQQPYPQQPYPPYGQGAYPNPYAQLPQQKSNTTRNVLLIVGAVVLLFCGGIVAFFVWVVNNVDDALDPDFPGSEKEPLTVAEGEAFSIRGFDYAAGWTVENRDGEVVVDGLRATNNRDDEDATSAYLNFRFYLANEQQASVGCNGVFDIAYGRSVRLQCSTYGVELVDFDEVEVYDNSYAE
ncbi:hypothetical protein [Nocardioides rubriscoriae]|uniref:hypothetical protein n=1 Tax=Nocardioides rubriscoriae TaxID=642762 RepID=UPI001478D0BA|nr:hypothetical protein [Nocardioides rubriscoriae]